MLERNTAKETKPDTLCSVLYAGAMALFLASSCSGSPAPLKLATTTSVENSGLMEVLLPAFEERHGYKVNVLSVGSGRAMKLAENGDVDAILVHCPDAERELVSKGFGVERTLVMENDFVLLGDPSDPGGLKGLDIHAALRRVNERKEPFVSRGDNSGTHMKEMYLWKEAGAEPGDNVLETGSGMGATLLVADEKRAYCLSDYGTYLAFKERIRLEVVSARDEGLLNPYSYIMVNPQRHPHVAAPAARGFG